MTKKKAVDAPETAEESNNNSGLADRLSSLMVSIRTTQATGAFTPEQESEWLAIDAELRGTAVEEEASVE